jgi:hypothetical protein
LGCVWVVGVAGGALIACLVRHHNPYFVHHGGGVRAV